MANIINLFLAVIYDHWLYTTFLYWCRGIAMPLSLRLFSIQYRDDNDLAANIPMVGTGIDTYQG